jgi:hypothetical protein
VATACDHFVAVIDARSVHEFAILFTIVGQLFDEEPCPPIGLIVEEEFIRLEDRKQLHAERMRLINTYRSHLHHGNPLHCRVAVLPS